MKTYILAALAAVALAGCHSDIPQNAMPASGVQQAPVAQDNSVATGLAGAAVGLAAGALIGNALSSRPKPQVYQSATVVQQRKTIIIQQPRTVSRPAMAFSRRR